MQAGRIQPESAPPCIVGLAPAVVQRAALCR